jgi:branched-chain amino acid transport system substrate-binding protein
MKRHWLMTSLSLLLVVGCAGNAAPPAAAPPAAAPPTAAPAPVATAASAAPTTASAPSGATPKISPNVNQSLNGKEIKIGVLTSTEGVAWAPSAKRQDQAIDIAVAEINAAGGINGAPIRIVSADSHGNLNTIADSVRRLAADENVEVIVGPLASGEGQIAYPAAAAQKVPIVCNGCAAAGLLDGSQPYAFRLVMQDDKNTEPVIAYAIKQKNIKTAAVINDVKDAVSKFMGTEFWPSAFKKYGVTNLTAQDPITFNTNDQSYVAQVTKLKALNPDAVATVGGPADVVRLAAELQRQGVKTQLLGSGGLQSAGSDFTTPCGSACEGMITAAQFWPENPDPAVAPIIKNFSAKCQCDITLNGAYAYDAMYMLADILRKGQYQADPTADREKLTQALHQVKDFTGAGGTFSLGADGDIVRAGMLATITNGKFAITAVPNS